MKTPRKVIIPTTFQPKLLPGTKVVPADLLPVAGVPAIERLVDAAHAAGLRDVLVIGDASSRLVEDHFDRNPLLERRLSDRDDWSGLTAIHRADDCRIHALRRSRTFGVGDAVELARDHVGDEPFVVMLPGRAMIDEGRWLRALIDSYERDGRSVALVDAGANHLWPRERRLEHAGRFVLGPDCFEALDRVPANEHRERDLGHALGLLERRRQLAVVDLSDEVFELEDPLQRFRADLAFFLADARAAPRVAAIVEESLRLVLAAA